MVKRFLSSQRTGFYFAVAQEGIIREGDPIEVVTSQANSLSVADITRLYAFERDDREMLRQAVHLKALPESWRNYFAEQLERIVP
jgi:MOSC domain-containing protein YiiM